MAELENDVIEVEDKPNVDKNEDESPDEEVER